MSRYRLGLYEKSMPDYLSLKEKLLETKRAGYDYLELSIDETDERQARLNWGDEEIRQLLDDTISIGIPIKSICLSAHRRFPLGSPDEGTQKKSLEIMEKAIVLAAKIGVRIIQIAGYDVYYEPSSETTKEIFARNLALSAEIAACHGVILAFETMETEFMNTVEKAMYWVNKINSPYLQVYPDIGNMTNAAILYETDVLCDLQFGIGHIAAVHLKETRPGVFREVPYGEGHVKFHEAAQASINIGARLFVGEFWYDDSQSDWRQVLKDNNLFLRAALERQ